MQPGLLDAVLATYDKFDSGDAMEVYSGLQDVGGFAREAMDVYNTHANEEEEIEKRAEKKALKGERDEAMENYAKETNSTLKEEYQMTAMTKQLELAVANE